MQQISMLNRRCGVFVTQLRLALTALVAVFALPSVAVTQAIPPAQAPVKPPQTAQIAVAWQGPVVRVTDASARPIELRDVRITTQIIGTQARTQIEMRLANPNDRVLEGELQFPLLDGQVVSGFALDINGQLRDAAAVPKARGQEIFEDIRRRRVDPALLEATAGNQYKLRVYPIPARGERRVMLTVSEQLAAMDARATWRLPLVFASVIDRLRVDIHVAGTRGDEVVVQRGGDDARRAKNPTIAHLTIERNNWRVQADAAAANGWLQLSVPVAARERILVGKTNDVRYFAADIPLVDEPVRSNDPKHIALIWDASASSAKQQRILPVLDAFFKSLRTPARVSLFVVRNKTEAVRELNVSATDWTALANALRAEPFDGSSNFDDLPMPKSVDLTILVSDGLTTDGKREIAYRHSAPLIALSGALATDVPRLIRIAEKSGGRYVDATAGTAIDAANAMWREGWRIVGVDSFDAKQLVAPALTVRNGQLQVAGVVNELPANVRVQLKHPSRGTRDIALKIEISPQDAAATATSWPGQLWATWQVAALSDEPHFNATAMQKISAEHGLVGANSSLIVLENATDYAQYELPAPPELRGEVAALRGGIQARKGATKQAHLDNMARQFAERNRWWERAFPKSEPPKPEAAKEKAYALGSSSARTRNGDAQLAERPASDAVTASAPTMSAPPAPVAPAAPAMSAASAPLERTGQRLDVSPRDQGAPVATMKLKAWSSDAVYLKRLRDAKDADMYRIYLDLRGENQDSSAFVLDVASHMIERGNAALGLRVLSNLAEMNLENRQLLRLYGYRLLEAKQYAAAIPVFDRVVQLAPNEPQSWRDLGLAYAENGNLQLAVDALWETVSRPWNARFTGVDMIALAELNALIAKDSKAVNTSRIDSRLIGNMPLDLRVVMSWDTDDTDVDLWLTDPNGEKSNYANRLSYQGAAMSPDATGGYGPEEFALRNAKPGKYAIDAQFYGQRQQVLTGGTTVMVRVTTGFGTPKAKDEWMTLRLVQGKETVRVGEVVVR